MGQMSAVVGFVAQKFGLVEVVGAAVEAVAGVEDDAGVEAAVEVFLNLKPLLALVVGATTTGGVLDLG